MIRAPERLLKRALLSAFAVAIEFTKSGQCLEVCSDEAEHTVHLALRARGKHIDDAVFERLFEDFWVAERYRVSGEIGLYPNLAGRIIDALGGVITAKSVGTTAAPQVVIDIALPRISPHRLSGE